MQKPRHDGQQSHPLAACCRSWMAAVLEWPYYGTVLVWSTGLIPLTLIVIKVLVISHEPEPWIAYHLRPDQWTWSEKLAGGLIRRLDDNSFWICVGLWLSAWRIRDAAWEMRNVSILSMLRDSPSRYRNFATPFRVAAVIWLGFLGPLLVAGAGVSASRYYYLNVKPFNGTFWWEPSDHLEKWSQEQLRQVKRLNYIEGCVFCASLFLGAAVVLLAANTSTRIAVAGRQPTLSPARTSSVAAAKLLAQGCMTPLIAGLLFYSVSTFLVDALHVSERGPDKSATPFVRAFGTIALYGGPFLLLLLVSVLIWPRSFRVDLPLFQKPVEWLGINISESTNSAEKSTGSSGDKN